jgi:hypothetical protein
MAEKSQMKEQVFGSQYQDKTQVVYTPYAISMTLLDVCAKKFS